MRRQIPLTLIAILGLGACTESDRARDSQSDSHAYEAGRKAREAADKAEKTLDEAGKKIEKAARDAEAGWKAGDRESREKKQQEDREKGGRP